MTTGIYDDLLSGFNNGCFPIFSLLLKMLFFQLVEVSNKVISHKRPVTVVLIWSCVDRAIYQLFSHNIAWILYILYWYYLYIAYLLLIHRIWIKAIVNWVWNFRTLKNKYNLTLCQSRLHTASETFVRHKKKSDRVLFFAFFGSVASILRGVLTIQSHRTSERQNPECRLSSSSTSSRSTKHCKDPCTLSSQELVVFFLICGSSIASKASNWATNILK